MHSRFALIGAAVLMSVALSDLTAQCVPSKRSPYNLRTDVAQPPGPGIEQLQSLARQYYPGFVRPDAPARVTVALLLDSTCNVLRHSAAFTPDSGAGWTTDALLRAAFPDLRERSVRGGIADAGHSTNPRQLWVAWTMLPRESAKQP